MSTSMHVTATRRGQVQDLMDRRDLDAVVLRHAENFAWYTGGGNSRVEYAEPVGAADVVITSDGDFVLAPTIEAPRMRAEETPGFTVVEYPWEQGPQATLDELIGEVELGADVALPGTVAIGEQVDSLRRVLEPETIDRLRGIGADLSAALAEAATAVRPGASERDAAAELAAACRGRGLVPTVLLAATDERIRHHRHPLPTEATISRRVMLVASAQRGGLYANLTRIEWFEEPDPDTARRQAACDEILARLREEVTLPGRSLAEAFDGCRRLYAEVGFPDEWRLHHQGGMTGYASREVIATPSTDVPIETGQAFSWNPSIAGAKSEDTFVLTDDGAEVVAGAGL
jgi:Xaa-Pro dipeptidase